MAAAPVERLGCYRLLRELGRGGQAIVWLAEDSRLSRQVALKVLPVRALGTAPDADEQMRRLWREAEITSRLEHPAICPIYEGGVDQGVPFLAMRYVDGETLARRITAARESGQVPVALRDGVGSGAWADLARFFARVAGALHVAHEAGVLHRDVKPANLMVTPSGDPVILDFGLAHDESGPDGMSRSGSHAGTPTYMSPEQMLGRAPVDRRTDVYSLGCSLFECMTGRPPFRAPTLEALLQAVLQASVPDARRHAQGVPKDLAVIVATATAREPERRYRTALDFAEDLERFVRRETIAARPASALDRLVSWCRRKPALAVSLGAASLLLLAASVATSYGIGAADRAVLQSELRALADAERQRLEVEQQRARQAAADRGFAERLSELSVRLRTLMFAVKDGHEGVAAVTRAYSSVLAGAGLDLRADDAAARGTALLTRLRQQNPDAAWAMLEALRNLGDVLPADDARRPVLAELAATFTDSVCVAFAAARQRWQRDRVDTFGSLLTESAIAKLSAEQLSAASAAVLDVSDREAAAMELLDRAIEKRPGSFALHYRRAGLGMGRAVVGGVGPQSIAALQEAVAHFRAAVALRPGSGLARAALAGALALRAGLTSDAAGSQASIRMSESSIEVEPDNALVCFLRADYLRRVPGGTQGAEVACRRALALEPNLTPAKRLMQVLAQDSR